MIPSWAHDVKPEDITNATMLDLAELLGTENMLTLVESYSGMIIYIPKLDSLLRNIRDRRIRQEYDGTNTRALALKYDVSESWVKRIASIDERGEIRGQTSLFDGSTPKSLTRACNKYVKGLAQKTMLQWLQPKGCGFFDWGGKSGGICFLGGYWSYRFAD